MTHNNEELWTQGIFDESVRIQLGSNNISQVPFDSLLGSPYIYSTTYNRQEFQIGGILEQGSVLTTYSSLISQAHAEARRALVRGNYNGALISRSIGSDLFMFAVPSILARTTESVEILSIIENNLLILDGYGNMPKLHVPDDNDIQNPINL